MSDSVMPNVQAGTGHGGLADRPGRIALLAAVVAMVLFIGTMGLTSDVDDVTQLWLSLAVAFGVPLLVGGVLALRQRTRRVGLGILAGIALGVPLTFVFMLWAVGEMASNIGS